MREVLPFDEVYRRYSDRVLRYCIASLHNRADAEDVTAEVFLHAYSHYERVAPDPGTVQFWLIRIAHNLIVDHARRERRIRTLIAALAPSRQRGPSVEDEVLVHDELERALAVIASLSERDRYLLGLRVSAGLSYAEIATTLHLTESATTSATYRALRRVARTFREL